MKIIAESKKEFEEIIRSSEYLHNVCFKTNARINLRFWTWGWCGIITHDYECLDQEKYPIVGLLAHLYRIKHAHKEGKMGRRESKYLKKIFYIESKK